MPKGKKKKGKKTSKSKKRSPSPKEQFESILGDDIKAYITTYIDSYMEYVEELNIDEGELPLFYTNYPFEVKGYILPDNSTCILFRGFAETTSIEIKKGEFEAVDREISDRNFDHICCYPPSHTFTKDEAEDRARNDVDQDVENSRLLRDKEPEREARHDTLRSIRFLSVAVPWVSTRKTEEAGLLSPLQDEEKFAPENLKIKEDEDFSSYSERLKNLEKTLIEGPKEEAPPEVEQPPEADKPAVAERPPEPEVPTPPPEKKPIVAEEPPPTPTSPTPSAPPPPPSVIQVKEEGAPSPKLIPVPPGQAGTAISIEIKQPEAPPRSEVPEPRKDIDVLRIKKTLYNQTMEIEDLKRKIKEQDNKLDSVKQTKETVFRMNRKVHETGTKMTQVEKSNRGLMRSFAELRTEQREENKKMRRFITEKTKKARNQAMVVAIVAIVLALVSLPFLIMLVMRFWGEIKTMFGF